MTVSPNDGDLIIMTSTWGHLIDILLLFVISFLGSLIIIRLFRITNRVGVKIAIGMLLVLGLARLFVFPDLRQFRGTTNPVADLVSGNSSIERPTQRTIVVSITNNHALYVATNDGIGNTLVKEDELMGRLNDLSKGKKDIKIYFRPSSGVDFQEISRFISSVNSAGYKQVSLITP